MRLTMSAEDFADAARAAAGAAAKDGMTVHSSVLMRAEAGGVRFMATDLVVGLSCERPARVEEPGAACAPAKLLAHAAKKVPGEEVELSVEGGRLELRAGNARMRFAGPNPRDFPEVPFSWSEKAPTASLRAGELRAALDCVARQMGRDLARTQLMGALLAFEEGGKRLRAVATDGHRLATRTVELEGASVSEGFPEEGALIPSRAVEELRRELASRGADETVRFALEGERAFFELGEDGERLGFAAKLIDEPFPPWRQVVPQRLARAFEVDAERLSEAVARVELVAGASDRALHFGFNPAGSSVLLSCSSERGEAREEVFVSRASGEAITVGVAPGYMRDALAAGGPRVAVEFGDVFDPLVFRSRFEGEGKEPTGESLHVVMPMRI